MSLFDHKLQVDVAVLDFSKAFDTVAHDKLMDKLEYYGINGNIHRWIANFLKQRQQCVVVDGVKPNSVHVKSGVPQGTVLGPLLFLFYINDRPRSVNSQVRLFADDCLLYRPIRSEQDHYYLQTDLNSLCDWAKTWSMSFNTSKCHIMSITNRRVTSLHLYSMLGNVLSKEDNIQYLGITIASNLRWENHITGLTVKANRTLGFLCRNLRTCPQQLRQLAHFSLVWSRLIYSSVAWDLYLAKEFTKLESIQRRAARFTMSDHRRRSSMSNMLERLAWESLQERRAMACLTIMKKILCGRVAINCDDYLERSSTRTRTADSAVPSLNIIGPTLTCLKAHTSPELYHFGMARLTSLWTLWKKCLGVL